MALLFVTLPFVVRAVQPVLLELDREMEQAAESLGASRSTVRGDHPPEPRQRRSSREAASPARAIGEFGRIGPDHGEPPVQHAGGVRLHFAQVESDNPVGASAVSVVLLVTALLVLLIFGWLSKRALRHEGSAPSG